jgi:hypothetical protein
VAKKSSPGTRRPKKSAGKEKSKPLPKKLIVEVDFTTRSAQLPPYYSGSFHVKGFTKKRRK